jgi:hypothetical protein
LTADELEGDEDNVEEYTLAPSQFSPKTHRLAGRSKPRDEAHDDGEEEDEVVEVYEPAPSRSRAKREGSNGRSKKAGAGQRRRVTNQPKIATTPATKQFPSFFKNPEPDSVLDVYLELRCEGKYSGTVPCEGGFEVYFKNLKMELGHDPIGGKYFPQYRVAKGIAALAESDPDSNVREELAKMQEEWEATCRPFWQHFYDKASRHMGNTPGKIPFASDGALNSACRRQVGDAVPLAGAKILGKRRTGSKAFNRASVLPIPDPNQDAHYVEQTAFLYHDPLKPKVNPLETGVADDDLQPLPPPSPLPELPTDRKCEWLDYDDANGHVVVVNFRDHSTVPAVDRYHFARLAERDDIVLIAEGVLPNSWTHDFVLKHVRRNFADREYHKIRRFDRHRALPSGASDDEGEGDEWKEADEHVSMQVDDFLKYLRRVRAVRDGHGEGTTLQNNENSGSTLPPEATAMDPMFTYRDPKTNEPTTVNVNDTTFYMIDIENYEALPDLDDKFKRAFKLEDFYPGGELDLMRAVRNRACFVATLMFLCILSLTPTPVFCLIFQQAGYSRPFMGPNSYVTPGGAFTQMHQDGHGTVNSGHVCLSGYNEVIMLRRLPTRHKEHAMKILKANGAEAYNLWKEPHCASQKVRPRWAKTEQIARLKKMKYVVLAGVLADNVRMAPDFAVS